MTNEERVNKFRLEEIAIHCETEEEAKCFVDWCYANGIEWYYSKPSETNFNYYKNETCYDFNFCDCERLGYGSKHFYEEKGYEVIKYKDFMKENKMTNLEHVASKGLVEDGNSLCYPAHACKYGCNCYDKKCYECEFNKDIDLCVQTLLEEHKEHIKLTKFEFDLLKAKLETHGYCYFSACIDLSNMKDNGYFKGIADTSTKLKEIVDNCEIVADDYKWGE